MSSSALYYPYIRVPESPWFTRVLLYWDRVGAIVPYEYIEDPGRLGPHMGDLVREGLVEQVIPSLYLWRVENFSAAFLEYVDAKYGAPGEPYKSDWASVDSQKMGAASIHMEKLLDLSEALCARGAARRDEKPQYSPWFKMEPRIANDFMAYLAGVLGQMIDKQFSPITDRRAHLGVFISDAKMQDRKYTVRQLVLENILPTPSKSIPAVELREFKEAHKESLIRFRKQIEEAVSELAAISDAELHNMRLIDMTTSFRETIDELTARMRERRGWPQLEFATLCAVVGSGMNAFKAVLDQDSTFGVGGAALSLAPAVYSAFRGSGFTLKNEPLAYAALAGRRFR